MACEFYLNMAIKEKKKKKSSNPAETLGHIRRWAYGMRRGGKTSPGTELVGILLEGIGHCHFLGCTSSHHTSGSSRSCRNVQHGGGMDTQL